MRRKEEEKRMKIKGGDNMLFTTAAGQRVEGNGMKIKGGDNMLFTTAARQMVEEYEAMKVLSESGFTVGQFNSLVSGVGIRQIQRLKRPEFNLKAEEPHAILNITEDQLKHLLRVEKPHSKMLTRLQSMNRLFEDKEVSTKLALATRVSKKGRKGLKESLIYTYLDIEVEDYQIIELARLVAKDFDDVGRYLHRIWERTQLTVSAKEIIRQLEREIALQLDKRLELPEDLQAHMEWVKLIEVTEGLKTAWFTRLINEWPTANQTVGKYQFYQIKSCEEFVKLSIDLEQGVPTIDLLEWIVVHRPILALMCEGVNRVAIVQARVDWKKEVFSFGHGGRKVKKVQEEAIQAWFKQLV